MALNIQALFEDEQIAIGFLCSPYALIIICFHKECDDCGPYS